MVRSAHSGARWPFRDTETIFRSPVRMILEGLEGLFLLAIIVPTWPLLKRWLDNLGTQPNERRATWPGDLLLKRIDETHTRAIKIAAPATRVWPWLHQLGLDRGGFFSYELLENMLGWRVKNVEQLIPDLEPLQIDDGVILVPGEASIWLSLLEKDRHLCFRTWRNDAYLHAVNPETIASWSFYLRPLNTGSTDSCRLVVRSCRYRRHGSVLGRWVARLVEDPLDFVMEQRMLRTIRRLATA